MLEGFKSKIETIAEEYADVVEKRIQTAIYESEINSTAMLEINEGIRMLNHVAATLERIDRLNSCGKTNGIN